MNRLSLLGANYFNPILLYHSTFSDVPTSLRGNVHNVTPDNLYKQLSWLKKNYDFVFVDDILSEHPKLGKCAVTFDDAYLSVFEEGLKVLETLKIPCTIFINSSSFSGITFWRDQVRFLINNNLVGTFVSDHSAYCASNQITDKNFYSRTKDKEVNSEKFVVELNQFLAKHGFQASARKFLINEKRDLISSPLVMYGNHTHDHYMLSSLETEQQNLQIDSCHQFLKESLPFKSVSTVFSIPFGGVQSITNNAMKWLRSNGYEAALMSRSRINLSYKMFNKTLHNFPILERFMPVDDFNLFKKQFLKTKIRSLISWQ